MKKEYLAEFQHKDYCKNQWINAAPYYYDSIQKRYCGSLKEAQEAIKKVKSLFGGKACTTKQRCGSIGICVDLDAKTADELSVIKTRIRVREVSEWKTVTEK